MKDIYILAIETSCDETSIAIVKNGCEVTAITILTQMYTHANFGGVVPEIASRMHTENITRVLEETLKKANMSVSDVNAIAVTQKPGLLGSLLVGIEFAKVLSYVYNKPLIAVNHLIGHIYANAINKKLEFPLLALVISGGHTEIVYMEKDYSFKKIGGTLDDSVGETYDKVARVMNVPYPGGPVLDKYAKMGKHTYNLPVPMDDDSYDFSFSGIKSAVINLVHNEKQRGNEVNIYDLATSFQDVVVDILTKKTMRAVKEYNVKEVIVAGGVSANSGIREKLKELCDKENVKLIVPELRYCTDNATMIAAAAYYMYKDGRFSDLTLNIKPTDKIN